MTTSREVLSLSAQLRQLLIGRIRSGMYPVGHRLDGVRIAANEFGVHSNTVSRVYRELTDMGILRTVHGSGTYVVTIPGPEHDTEALETIRSAVHKLAEQARRIGISHDDWLNLASAPEVFNLPTGDGPAVWMVECSRRDVDELALGLSRVLDREISPVLVDELDKHPDAGHDTFITTPFHFDEVNDIVGDTSRVLTVNVVPTSATLVQFAQLPAGVPIDVIASNAPTLGRMVRMIETYARRKPRHACLVDSPEAASVVAASEVVVDGQSVHERVLGWGPGGQVVTVRYQIEPNSVEYVRAALSVA